MKLKKTIPYIVAIVIFIIASLTYFSPVLKNQKIQQGDITQFIGSSKEIVDHRAEFEEESYWTNSSFSGMPAYVISAYYPHNYIKKLDNLIRFLPRPADYLFLYFLGFFILLMTLKVNWKLAVIGALGFGFSTYMMSLFGAGHNAKAHAIAYMPVVMAGIILVFQRKYLLGFVVTSLAMSLELMANHIQMTYYLFFMVLIYGVVQLIQSIKEKEIPHFAKSIGILIGAVILAIGTNATNLLATQEYAKYSTRSKSELTITPEGAPKIVTSGLSKEYITEYSYGKWETFSLFIPRFVGGTRYEEVKDSQLRAFLQDAVNEGLNPDDANYLMQITSMYWGEMPIVAAPYYIGAIFIFLFVLALFLVDGKWKKWLVAATVFSILLSWGKHFSVLTNFFIDYVPLYTKFRAVSSIQIIAEICIPLLGLLGLNTLISDKITVERKLNGLKWATIIVGGFALLFVIGGQELFSFETPIDVQIDEQVSGYLDAVTLDRYTLFYSDSLRTLLLVLGIAGVLWLYLKQKINKDILLVGFLGLLLFDMVGVDKRYVNNDNFTSARKVNKPFKKSIIDQEILKDKEHYRVADFTKNLLADGATPYYHNSLGGYSAVKMGRYQELYDFHVAKRNPEVLNMLNTKYVIVPDEKGAPTLAVNSNANGNAWFVNELKFVVSADEEIKALDSLNTKTIVVLSSRYTSDYKNDYPKDSLAQISLTDYKANAISYQSNSKSEQFAVFSEMYYKDGWNSYIDGKLTKHFRVNYVLRGMEIPAGNHTIEFKFEPKVIKTGSTIALASYALLFLIPIGWFLFKRKKKKYESTR
tara:strand:+ start:4072 stop:6507 length:2436 start_codon:yes stop_codon:yes gene_type:complete